MLDIHPSLLMENGKGTYPSPGFKWEWPQEEPSENLTWKPIKVRTGIWFFPQRVSMHKAILEFLLFGGRGKGKIWVETCQYVHNLERQRKYISLCSRCQPLGKVTLRGTLQKWGDLKRGMNYIKLEVCQQVRGGVIKTPRWDSSLDIIASRDLQWNFQSCKIFFQPTHFTWLESRIQHWICCKVIKRKD